MVYVTDAHALAWFCAGDKRLGKKAKKVFLAAEKNKCGIFVPTIALAEIKYAVERKREAINFAELYEWIKETKSYQICPFDEKVLEKYNDLDESLEIHDRIIVATALTARARLITKDKTITKSELVEAVW